LALLRYAAAAMRERKSRWQPPSEKSVRQRTSFGTIEEELLIIIIRI